jgi:hypothetical protein
VGSELEVVSDPDEMRLEWFEDAYTYFIAWADPDGMGLALGEDADRPDCSGDHKAATEAARIATLQTFSVGYLGRLEWESVSAVKKALRAARAAVKAWRAELPMPDWALKATAEGWKPPKGWRPSPPDQV